MDTTLAFSAVFETVEDGWVQGRLVELPAVITAAPSMAEAKRMLVDALAEWFNSFMHCSPDASPAGNTLKVTVVISAA